jgi:hypothetical protein
VAGTPTLFVNGVPVDIDSPYTFDQSHQLMNSFLETFFYLKRKLFIDYQDVYQTRTHHRDPKISNNNFFEEVI